MEALVKSVRYEEPFHEPAEVQSFLESFHAALGVALHLRHFEDLIENECKKVISNASDPLRIFQRLLRLEGIAPPARVRNPLLLTTLLLSYLSAHYRWHLRRQQISKAIWFERVNPESGFLTKEARRTFFCSIKDIVPKKACDGSTSSAHYETDPSRLAASKTTQTDAKGENAKMLSAPLHTDAPPVVTLGAYAPTVAVVDEDFSGAEPREIRICRQCNFVCPKATRSFCSDACLHFYKIRSSPSYVRKCLLIRDGGVCAICRLNCEALKRAVNLFLRRTDVITGDPVPLHVQPDPNHETNSAGIHSRRGRGRKLKGNTAHEGKLKGRSTPRTRKTTKKQQLEKALRIAAGYIGCPPLPSSKIRLSSRNTVRGGSFWHADHIMAVCEGGGNCSLENFRTLCIPCHKKVTATLRCQRVDKSGTRNQISAVPDENNHLVDNDHANQPDGNPILTNSGKCRSLDNCRLEEAVPSDTMTWDDELPKPAGSLQDDDIREWHEKIEHLSASSNKSSPSGTSKADVAAASEASLSLHQNASTDTGAEFSLRERVFARRCQRAIVAPPEETEDLLEFLRSIPDDDL